jgi:hypothetical protein
VVAAFGDPEDPAAGRGVSAAARDGSTGESRLRLAWLARAISEGPALSDVRSDDLPALAGAAEAHGVSALLWDALAQADGEGARLRDALGPKVRAAVAHDLLLQHELSGLLAACAASSVRALPVKGAALAYTTYAQPWHRPRTDTDLLVTPSSVPAASAVLERCGYRRSDAVSTGTVVSHQAVFERTDARGVHHVVDLHWRIVNPHLLARSVAFEDLWARAVAVPALGPAARAPRPVDAVLVACIHRLAHHHGHERLVWLYDLRLLSRDLDDRDWSDLCRSATAAGIAGLCLDGLRQASALVNATLPAAADAVLAEASLTEPSRMYLHEAVHRRDVLASDLAALPTWRARLQLLCEHAFPPSAFLLQRYGVRSRVWLPALYAHRLLTGARKWWGTS